MNMRGPWFFTGDYVDVDKKGVVRILDRKDNICRVITEWVIPKKVEKILQQCPGVDRAAILNVKDPLGKLQLTAVIVKKAGMDVNVADIMGFCVNQLPEYQRPKNIAFIGELPLDIHGEINKYRLRYEFNS
jgi:acyl-CoA synthetase (AMP-forming)/AMP-acid ligase II